MCSWETKQKFISCKQVLEGLYMSCSALIHADVCGPMSVDSLGQSSWDLNIVFIFRLHTWYFPPLKMGSRAWVLVEVLFAIMNFHSQLVFISLTFPLLVETGKNVTWCCPDTNFVVDLRDVFSCCSVWNCKNLLSIGCPVTVTCLSIRCEICFFKWWTRRGRLCHTTSRHWNQ